MPNPDDWIQHTLSTQGIPLTGSALETMRCDWDGDGDGPPGQGEEDDTTETLVLESSIAKGGMGWIRQARQTGIDRVVAVKSLLPGERRASAASALLREARLTGQLEHPNIVPVHELRASSEGPLMVMKHIEGRSWAALLKAGAPLERHLEVAMALCQALHYAHRRGVVHRDVKPANVMVGELGEVYLLDWGVACAPQTVTGDQPLQGTPAYMAPEMVVADGRITPQTDVFLLGAALQHALTGRTRNPSKDLFCALQEAREAAPFDWPPGIPPELAAICDRACARAPSARFPDAAALREALAAFLRHRSAVAASTAAAGELAQLQALAAAPVHDPLQVHRRYSACRFGFEQALREWPESPEARDGLQAVLEEMIRFEIAAGTPRAAAPLLDELPSPRPALAAEVQAAIAHHRDAADQLAELQRESRMQGQDWGRSLVTLLNGALSAILLMSLWFAAPALEDISQPVALAFLGTCTAMLGLATVVFRRYLLSNRVYVRLMVVLDLLCPLMMLNHGLSWQLGIPMLHSFLTDCIICCAMNLTLAAVVDRVFWVSSAIAVVATVVITLNLSYALPLVAVSYALNSVYLAWVLRPTR